MLYEFSEHAREMLRERGILKSEVTEGIRNAIYILKRGEVYSALINLGRGKIEVLYKKEAKFIKIITLYWR